ncbi:MAG: primosomal protein N' [Bacteroidetes bacterium]|nr:primosomal protein N' [Bacteroidota bacterium]
MFNERNTLFVDVLLPLAMPVNLTYRVPFELNELVTIGKRVVVQVGKKKLYAGIVAKITETVPSGYEVKYIISVLDDVPVVTNIQLEFWKWISEYYLCTQGEVMKAALPAALRLESESLVALTEDYNSVAELDEKENFVIEYLEKVGETTISNLALLLNKQNIHNLIKSLYQKGIVILKEDISDNYKPKFISCLRINPAFSDIELNDIFNNLEKKSKKQLESLMNLYSWQSKCNVVEKSKFIKENGVSSGIIDTLAKKDYIEIYKIEKFFLNDVKAEKLPELTPNQNTAFEEIEKVFSKDKICLLHGVTSSGKTHIYFKLIEKVVNEGKEVLYIVPEMALTAQLVNRFKKYFGNIVEITHSGYSINERFETWNHLSEGKIKIILGVRSSVFMPFKKLGLVIIDEEHESTLKQQDPAPRYHARDCATMLAKMFNAKVLLGSATPSIESWYNVQTGKYDKVCLTERFGDSKHPKIDIINLSEAQKTNRMKGPFSTQLLEEIKNVLERQKQVIIFQNRRGYVPVTECSICGWIPRCVNCDVSLTYFNSTQNYRCSFCGFKKDIVNKCESCGSTRLKLMGYGTERLEEELKIFFPDSKIIRFDSESAKNHRQQEKIIKSFENKEIDIIVGTQMISKGFDFENLELVGIVNADHSINFPDFRSAERSFQLFTQVSGRAGRRIKPGKVIVQTYQPWHKVIEALKNSNITDLYDRELGERLKFNYPPYFRIIRLTIKHPENIIVIKASDILALHLKNYLKENVLGPESPYISRIRNYYIKQIIVKFDPKINSTSKIRNLINNSILKIKSIKELKSVIITPDVDPYF